jgi:DNA damage-binding protein 1
MTDHPDPELIFLTYQDTTPGTPGTPSLSQTSHLSLYEKSPRPAEYFNSVLIDASGKFAVVSCYAGKLKFLFLQNGDYQSDVDLSCVTD